jgi:hypothetical protein
MVVSRAPTYTHLHTLTHTHTHTQETHLFPLSPPSPSLLPPPPPKHQPLLSIVGLCTDTDTLPCPPLSYLLAPGFDNDKLTPLEDTSIHTHRHIYISICTRKCLFPLMLATTASSRREQRAKEALAAAPCSVGVVLRSAPPPPAVGKRRSLSVFPAS